jgi:hypothetical protein
MPSNFRTVVPVKGVTLQASSFGLPIQALLTSCWDGPWCEGVEPSFAISVVFVFLFNVVHIPGIELGLSTIVRL